MDDFKYITCIKNEERSTAVFNASFLRNRFLPGKSALLKYSLYMNLKSG